MEWKYWRKILGGICMVLFSIVLLLEGLFLEWRIWQIPLLAGVLSLAGFVKVYWNIPSEEEEKRGKQGETQPK